MFREITALGFVMILLFFVPDASGASPQAYVSDFQRITLRTGPSLENKIIAFLVSGQALEVLEKRENWSRVRTVEESGDGREGWVLNQFLTDRLPYRLQASSLLEENRLLKARLEPVKQQLEDAADQGKTLSLKLEESEAALQNLQEEFLSLQQEAAQYLMLKAEHEATRSRLERAEQENIRLMAENKKLRESERNTWFLTGALVLLCGLLLGFMFGRQKRRKSAFY